MRDIALYLPVRAAWCVGLSIPGALSILKGAVPDRTRGSGHMAPTYLVGSRDRQRLTAKVARTFLPLRAAARACLLALR